MVNSKYIVLSLLLLGALTAYSRTYVAGEKVYVNTDQSSNNDTDQKGSGNIQYHKDTGDYQSYDREEARAAGKCSEIHESGGAVNDDAAALQADQRYEQTDTGSDRLSHRHGQCVHYRFPHVSQGEDHEDETLDQDGREGELP